MKIVFYSTRSEKMSENGSKIVFYPSRADEWDRLADLYPEHEFIVVAPVTAVYLYDLTGNQVSKIPKKVAFSYLSEEMTTEEIVDIICGFAPDAAIAVSTAGRHYDWNPIKDAVIAEILQQKGINAIAQKIYTAVGSFDKWRSSLVLRGAHFDVAKSLYVHNNMFWTEKNHPSIETNVYKEYILYRLKGLHYPVIIKTTAHSGSRGIEIVEDYEAAEKYLCAEDYGADMIAEEMLPGEQFGTEIHGIKGHYYVLPPYALPTNSKGITDPLTGIKFGPVMNDQYHVKELQESLGRMAEEYGFAGVVQVDLVFHEGKWSIIEFNPRWSGMTTTTAASEGRMPYEVFADTVLGSSRDYSKWENLKYAVNFKIPEAEEKRLQEMYTHPGVKYIMSSTTQRPNQPKSTFAEVVFGGFDTKEELMNGLQELREKFPDVVSETVYQSFVELSKKY